MKKAKFFSIILSILTIFLLLGCGSDDREYYIEHLEELDRSDLAGLNRWLDDNEESMNELFEFVDIRVDLEGNELDFMSQVLGLDSEYFDSWSFEVDDDTITFIYIWDYESATAALEEEILEEEVLDEDTSPLAAIAADNEWLVNWVESTIPIFEEINIESHLLFIATTAGFTTSTRSAMEDLNASSYKLEQMDHVVTFIEGIEGFVIADIETEEYDLAVVRDIVLDGLTDLIELLSEDLE